MSTNNKIFIDSSVLIEALKGNKNKFYSDLISNNDHELFINDIVVSEYLYFVLGFSAGISSRTLKERQQISETLSANETLTSVLSDFSFAGGNFSILSMAPSLMKKHNLLPNDAIILATCKIHNITKLASHDTDFILPCQSEGIELLREEGL